VLRPHDAEQFRRAMPWFPGTSSKRNKLWQGATPPDPVAVAKALGFDAIYTDETGVSTTTATLTSPSDFTNAAWTKTGSTVTHGFSDPAGGSSADRIEETAVTSGHGVSQALVTAGYPEGHFPRMRVAVAVDSSSSPARNHVGVGQFEAGLVNPRSYVIIHAGTCSKRLLRKINNSPKQRSGMKFSQNLLQRSEPSAIGEV
jgi:hypothetical protein